MTLGVMPFGLITGVSAVAVGLPKLEAILMSVIVFAGASQLVALQLMATGSPILVILLATFFINLRHLMYSLSLAKLFAYATLSLRVLMSYLMTDQAYAFSVNKFGLADAAPRGHWYYLGIALPLWFLWILMSALGVFLGAQIPAEWSLDFAIPLTFMALLFAGIRNRPMLIAAITGGSVALVAANLPYNLGLITAALLGIMAGLLAEKVRPS